MPYKKAKTDAETEEERRLFYVGNDEGKRSVESILCKTKNGKENKSFPFCR